MREALAFLAGVVTSLALELPFIKKRWHKQQFKAAVLFFSYMLSSLAAWLVNCQTPLELGVPCDYQGIAELGWTGAVAFAGSQGAYFTRKTAPKAIRYITQSLRD